MPALQGGPAGGHSNEGSIPALSKPAGSLPHRPPRIGELVEVRSRRWLVEAVEDADTPPASPRVSLACADDDAQGQTLEVYWDFEIDRRILEQEAWSAIGARGFDPPRHFSAFLHTLRWNCVTATDPNLFQAPFRAGIKIDAYQMEPLRKALRMPRVNLFIADDTGLGKTIEAGLIARELLLRKKAKTIVAAAPASVLEQWKAEMEERFGLLFVILDRAYLTRVRQERGFGVNPWRTHSRFLVSHNLLIDPTYADPLREWLGDLLPGSLLILDEAHHAAPSSGGRYGIETRFTRAIRDLGGRFEHRLFLSATPHNGHSNSFSTLLELLDPYRFTRGVPVRGKNALDEVMVRRIKEDLREVQGGFPERDVRRIAVEGLPEDAPELVLSRLLDEYRGLREERLKNGTARARAAAALLVVGLQQKLLSSIEAFAISLARHRTTVRRQWERTAAGVAATVEAGASEAATGEAPGSDHGDALAGARRFASPPDADDERAEYTEDERAAEEAAQIAALDAAAEAGSASSAGGDARAEAIRREEESLLDRMEEASSAARGLPDAKTRRLIDWIREHLCPDLPPCGERAPRGGAGAGPDSGLGGGPGPLPRWNERRVLIFTENVVGTKRYLRAMLEQAIAGTDLAEERIETIDGQTVGAKRREIQRRFNADPARDPLRILLATDAAREGLNFQAHCTDLFHFDLPWNPGRIEQRNGRIDRKLQPAPRVRCHYFVLPQRAEDRVLEVLVRKTETIKRELGSLSKVIDDDVERRLRGGIRHRDAIRLAREIEAANLDRERRCVAAEELEAARERQEDLKEQIERCRGLLEGSRGWVRFEAEPFCDAMSCALELVGAAPLREGRTEDGGVIWTFPPLTGRARADASDDRSRGRLAIPRRGIADTPDRYRGQAADGLFHASWNATLDTLRAPRKTGQKLAEWRREAPIRPVVFEDAGGAHRQHRAPAPGTADSAAPARPIPRPGVRAPRSLPRLSGAGRRLHPPRGAPRKALPVRAPGRAPARGAHPGRRPLDRALAPRRAAPGVRRGGGGENPRTPGGRLAGRPCPGRYDSPSAPRYRRPGRRRPAAAARGARQGGRPERGEPAARARRTRGAAASRDPGTPAPARRSGAEPARGPRGPDRARVQRGRETPTRGRRRLLAHTPRPVRPRPRDRAGPRPRVLRGAGAARRADRAGIFVAGYGLTEQKHDSTPIPGNQAARFPLLPQGADRALGSAYVTRRRQQHRQDIVSRRAARDLGDRFSISRSGLSCSPL